MPTSRPRSSATRNMWLFEARMVATVAPSALTRRGRDAVGLHDLLEEVEHLPGVGVGRDSIVIMNVRLADGDENQTEVLYLNGAFMPLSEGRISVEDRGFELGDGIYEVIKVMNARLVWLRRPPGAAGAQSGVRSGSPRRWTGTRWTRCSPNSCRARVSSRAWSTSRSRGGTRRGSSSFPPHRIPPCSRTRVSIPHRRVSAIMAGIALHPVEDLRWARCDIKSTNLLAAVLAKEEARDAGADEALFMAPDGMVREGGSSNVFAVIDGVFRTHPLNNRILGGITRKHVIEIARRLGYAVEERAFTLEEVATEPARAVRGLHRLDHEGHAAGRAHRRSTWWATGARAGHPARARRHAAGAGRVRGRGRAGAPRDLLGRQKRRRLPVRPSAASVGSFFVCVFAAASAAAAGRPARMAFTTARLAASGPWPSRPGVSSTKGTPANAGCLTTPASPS